MEALDKATVTSELEQRLATLRARKEEIERQREARSLERAQIDEVEAAELAVRDAEALAKAEEEVGPLGDKIAATYTRKGVIIVKRPHTALFRRFQDSKEASTEEALKLIRPSLVYPDRITFDQWVDEVPGALLPLARQCCELSGFRAKEVEGK